MANNSNTYYVTQNVTTSVFEDDKPTKYYDTFGKAVHAGFDLINNNKLPVEVYELLTNDTYQLVCNITIDKVGTITVSPVKDGKFLTVFPPYIMI